MGLRQFHIFFVVVSVLLVLGFGSWCFFAAAGRATPGAPVMGSVSVVVAVLLAIYGKAFLRKLDKEGIL
jgi:hypothetical protein